MIILWIVKMVVEMVPRPARAMKAWSLRSRSAISVTMSVRPFCLRRAIPTSPFVGRTLGSARPRGAPEDTGRLLSISSSLRLRSSTSGAGLGGDFFIFFRKQEFLLLFLVSHPSDRISSHPSDPIASNPIASDRISHASHNNIRIGLVARIPRFHRGGRGSIPRCGTIFSPIP